MPSVHLTGKTIAALPIRTPLVDEHGNLQRAWVLFFESLLPTGPITLAYTLTDAAGIINIERPDPGPGGEYGRLAFSSSDPTRQNVVFVRAIEGASSDEGDLEIWTSLAGAAAVKRMTIARDGTVTMYGKVVMGSDLAVTGKVDITGNLASIRAVPYTWPASQGALDSFVRNDGAGVLTWIAGAAARTALNVPQKITSTAGNIVLAKLTPGGTNGQITVNADGLISAWVGPT